MSKNIEKDQQPGQSTEWRYDANGNRTHENGQLIARYDSQDRLLQWKDNTYAYSEAGDLQEKTTPQGATRYAYDSLGNLRLVTLPDGAQIEYLIDPFNRRIGKKKNGQLQYGLIYQDSLRPIADTDENGKLRSIYLYADKGNVPTAMLRADKSYLIISDHLGSVRQVIDTQTGEIVQQLDYDAWGHVTEDSRPGFQPFGFAGGLHDPDTQLTRFGARDYDAETGRWTAKDPILFDGGDSNLYGYVSQDPVNLKDGSGLAEDGQPLNRENCDHLNTLIDREKFFGKRLTTLIYNPINFTTEAVGLDAAYPSLGGPVSIDWMMRAGFFGMGELSPLIPRQVYMSAKALRNMMSFNSPAMNIRGEANWNAASAYSYWANNDVTLEQMFAPSLEICKCQK